jgi:mannose-1-phosphate guanylyltransferase
MTGSNPLRPRAGAAAAMVLAAGYGTRLRPLTEELPKPLVPIGDRPLLQHLAERLRAAGIRRLVINSHHHADAFGRAALAALGLPVELLHEPEILGTAGGVHNARDALGPGDVVVWNGDILAQIDLGALLAAHAAGQAVATLAVCPAPRAPGTIGLDAGGGVVRLRAERYGPEAHGEDFVGIQVLSSALRGSLPSQGCLVGDLYQPALRNGLPVRAASVVSSWRDVGTPAAYLAANVDWLAEQGKTSFVGVGATVESGVRLDHSVVGAGATVVGLGALRRVVVWPGARAEAPLEDAIVTTAGRVVSVAR